MYVLFLCLGECINTTVTRVVFVEESFGVFGIIVWVPMSGVGRNHLGVV